MSDKPYSETVIERLNLDKKKSQFLRDFIERHGGGRVIHKAMPPPKDNILTKLKVLLAIWKSGEPKLDYLFKLQIAEELGSKGIVLSARDGVALIEEDGENDMKAFILARLRGRAQ